MAPEERVKELKLARTETTGKMLEVNLELSKIRKLWLADGVQTPIAVRASLEHQLAELDLQRYRIDRDLAAAESLRRAANSVTFHSLLVKKMGEAGLDHLVREARREADAAQDAASHDHQQPATQPGAQ